MIKLLCAIGLLSGAVSASEPTTVTEPTIAETTTVTEENSWDKFVKDYLNAEKVAMYMSWIAYIGTIIGLVANIKKLKKQNNLTLKDVSLEVQNKLKDAVSEELQTYVPSLIDTQKKTNDVLQIFSKILALSQENTPESKIAILNLIEELGTIGKDITDNSKAVVEESVKAIEEHKKELELQAQELEKHKEEINQKLENFAQYDGTSI